MWLELQLGLRLVRLYVMRLSEPDSHATCPHLEHPSDRPGTEQADFVPYLEIILPDI